MAIGVGQARAGSTAAGKRIDWFSTDDGLPHNTVQALAQSPDGYLWLGTRGGLAQFDGADFVIHRVETQPALPSSDVVALAVGEGETLWIGTSRGLAVRDRGGFRAERLPLGGVNCAALAAAGDELLVGGEWGVAWGQPGTWRRLESVGAVRAIQMATRRCAWLSTSQGLYRWAWPFSPSNLVHVAAGSGGPRLALHGDFAWATVSSELLQVQSSSGEVVRRWAGVKSSPLIADRRGGVWLTRHPSPTLPEGLEQWTPGGALPFEPALLGEVSFLAAVEDRIGALWLGTQSHGVYRLRRSSVRQYGVREGLPHREVGSIRGSADGGLWVATRLGPARWTGSQFEAFPWSNGPGRPVIWALGVEEALVAAGDRVVRVGPRGMVDELGGIVAEWRFLSSDRHGAIRVGGVGGVWRRDPDGNWSREPGLPPGPVWTGWEEGPGGEVWAGTADQGLFHRPVAGDWKPVPLPGNPRAAAVAWWDEEDRPWLASSDGLYRRRGGGWDHWSTAQGLAEEAVLGLLPDGRGGLYVQGPTAIQRIERRELEEVLASRLDRLRPRVIGGREGLASAEFQEGGGTGCFRDGRGHLWFPTTGGVVELDPAQMDEPAVPRPILVEVLEIQDGTEANRIPVDQPGRFARGTGRHLVFRFTAPAPSDAFRIRVEYRLQGLDRAWRSADFRREAAYGGVPPGRHRFEVRAASADGRWHPEVAAWEFEVVPEWWERQGVRAAGGFLGVGFLAGLGWFRLQWQRRVHRWEQAQALENERRRLSRDLHDGFGSDLARISLAAATGPVDVGEACRDLMARLERVVWLTDPAQDRLDRLGAYLLAHVEQYLAPTSLHLHETVTPDLPPQPVPGIWRRELLAVMQECLSNIARHSGCRNVWFQLDWSPDRLEVELRDDGRGFDPGRVRPGRRGLGHLRQRAVSLGGRLELGSMPGQGTRVRLVLPWPPPACPTSASLSHD